MSFPTWALLVLAWLALDAWIIVLLIRRGKPAEPSWFVTEQFLRERLRERVREYAPGVIVHPCSYGGDLLEYQIARGWDEEAILHVLAEIEAL